MMNIAALIGPTASGKTDIALTVAKKTGAHILSCDSLLVYKDMSIGTAKPTNEELSAIPHHAVNLVNANENFTLGDYIQHAKAVFQLCESKNIPLLIVGGTGFYLKALVHGIWDAPPTDETLRKNIVEPFEHLPEEEQCKALHQTLLEKDADYARKIHQNDRYRLIRALEIIAITGEPVSTMLARKKAEPNTFSMEIPVYGIEREKSELEKRIRARTEAMFQAGLIDETSELLKKYAPTPPRPLHSVGYLEAMSHIKGEMTLDECRERVIISTRQLAKKQRTFFNGMKIPIQWFSLPSQQTEMIEKLLAELRKK